MRREKKSNIRIVDTILLFLNTLTTIGAVYYLSVFTFLSFKIRMLIVAVVVVLFLLVLVLYFKRWKQTKMWVYRGFVFLMCLILGFSTFYIYKSMSAINIIANNTDILVVTKSTSSIQNVEDLVSQSVGVQETTDRSNMLYAQESLDKLVATIDYQGFDNYSDLMDALNNGKVQAIIVPSKALADYDAKVPNYSSSLRTLTQFSKKSDSTITPGSFKNLSEEPFTVLLSGIDTSDEGDVSERSDAVMVLIVNPKSNHIEMVSFPRDSYVPNLALGGGSDKLTHLSNDGVQNMMDSLALVIGFDIDYYVQVNFTSLLEVVDALGGVEVDVLLDFTEQNSNRVEGTITLTKGVQTLNGEEALAYSRHRHTEGWGDIGRTKAQQQVLKAIITKMASKDGVINAAKILDIVSKYVKTDISSDQIAQFTSYEMEHLGPWTIGSTTLANGLNVTVTNASMGNSLTACYLLDFQDVQKLYQKYTMLFHPSTFEEFQFDLNDTYEYLPKLERNPQVIFSDDDYSIYTYGVEI